MLSRGNSLESLSALQTMHFILHKNTTDELTEAQDYFIQAISVVPLQVRYYSEALPT